MPQPRGQPRRAPARRTKAAVRWLARRLTSLFGITPRVRQSLVALALNSVTSLVAGAVLGSITGTLEQFPGLLVLVPAAIGLRGNIFSTFGNRISTAIHTGEFDLSLRSDSVLRQNIDASMVLTLFMSVVVTAMAWTVAAAVGVQDLSSPLALAVISILGGFLASLVVLAASIGLVAGAVRYGWDLDNVVAPVVSTLGDVLTLPALWVAAYVADIPVVSPLIGVLLTAVSLGVFVAAVRSHRSALRRVTLESWPVLSAAALLSTFAGLVLEQRLVSLAAFPALLMLQPAFVSSAGALGGVLSSRTSSNLHLGLVAASRWPDREVRGDIAVMFGLFLPVYLLNGAGAHLLARLLGETSPGLATMLAAALLGGAVAVAFALTVAYYGTIVALATGVDPDTYGIPLVTSSVDFGGVIALIAAIAVLGATVG